VVMLKVLVLAAQNNVSDARMPGNPAQNGRIDRNEKSVPVTPESVIQALTTPPRSVPMVNRRAQLVDNFLSAVAFWLRMSLGHNHTLRPTIFRIFSLSKI
ncbi:hypothetical protein, partial [uncultured Sphingomonas sp.]|uniref:hypothetical protein n=1 Tax=uncultured Sphingomonas sp. TaxID=158754 RepID=UPI00261700C7